MRSSEVKIAGYLLLLLCVLVESEQTSGKKAIISTCENIGHQDRDREEEDIQESMIQQDEQENDMNNQIAEKVTMFGLNFINKLSSINSENVVISPLSLHILLNMIHLGSEDGSETESELNQVLGYHDMFDYDEKHLSPVSKDSQTSSSRKLDIHKALSNLIESVYSSMKLTPEDERTLHGESSTSNRDRASRKRVSQEHQGVLNLANMMLYNVDRVKPKPDYKSEIEEFYNAKIGSYSSWDLDALPERVNAWTKNKTNGMIDQIMNIGDIHERMVSVLLNAAYMKGRWRHPFNKRRTKKLAFYNGGETEAFVDFMSEKNHFDVGTFTDDSDADDDSKKLTLKVLSIPFYPGSGREVSMVILLPEKRDGIAELQSALDSVKLHKIYKSLDSEKILLSLPKFSFETSVDKAKEVLIELGLKSVFSNSARLDKMFYNASLDGETSRSKVKVYKVKHKARITVDELGAEAAAVTYGDKGHMSMPRTFIVDHPFLFIIRHNKSGLPLFIGRVNKL